MFIGQGREGDGGEAATLQPVDRGGVDRHRLLCGDVWTVLSNRASIHSTITYSISLNT